MKNLNIWNSDALQEFVGFYFFSRNPQKNIIAWKTSFLIQPVLIIDVGKRICTGNLRIYGKYTRYVWEKGDRKLIYVHTSEFNCSNQIGERPIIYNDCSRVLMDIYNQLEGGYDVGLGQGTSIFLYYLDFSLLLLLYILCQILQCHHLGSY